MEAVGDAALGLTLHEGALHTGDGVPFRKTGAQAQRRTRLLPIVREWAAAGAVGPVSGMRVNSSRPPTAPHDQHAHTLRPGGQARRLLS